LFIKANGNKISLMAKETYIFKMGHYLEVFLKMEYLMVPIICLFLKMAHFIGDKYKIILLMEKELFIQIQLPLKAIGEMDFHMAQDIKYLKIKMSI
jgi:hypothetical protein